MASRSAFRAAGVHANDGAARTAGGADTGCGLAERWRAAKRAARISTATSAARTPATLRPRERFDLLLKFLLCFTQLVEVGA